MPFNELTLDHPIVASSISGPRLVCLLKRGLILVWDFEKRMSISWNSRVVSTDESQGSTFIQVRVLLLAESQYVDNRG